MVLIFSLFTLIRNHPNRPTKRSIKSEKSRLSHTHGSFALTGRDGGSLRGQEGTSCCAFMMYGSVSRQRVAHTDTYGGGYSRNVPTIGGIRGTVVARWTAAGHQIERSILHLGHDS